MGLGLGLDLSVKTLWVPQGINEDNLVQKLGDSLETWFRASKPDVFSIGGSREFVAANKISFQRADNVALSTTTGDIFVNLHVYPTTVTGNQCLIAKGGTSAGSVKGWSIWRNGTTINAYICDGVTLKTITVGTVAVNRWYNICVTYDRSGNAIGYLDNVAGTPVDISSFVATDIDEANDFVIGAYVAGSTASDWTSANISRVVFAKGTTAGSIIDSAATRTSLYNLGYGVTPAEAIDLITTLVPAAVLGTDFDCWGLHEISPTSNALSASGLNDLTLITDPPGQDSLCKSGPNSQVILDSSSNANHGTAVNTASDFFSTNTADGSPNPTVLNAAAPTTYPGLMVGFADPSTARTAHGLTGVPGKKITFDGVDDYIVLSAPSDVLAPSTLSVMITINFDATTGTRVWLSCHKASSGTGWAFFLDSGNTLYFQCGNGGGWPSGSTSVAWTPSTGVTYHVAAVKNGTSVKFFVNGVQQGATQTLASGTVVASGNPLWLCADVNVGGNYVDGFVVDPRIFLSDESANIATIAAGDNGTTGSPVLRYDFNEANTRSLTAIGTGTSGKFDMVDDYITVASRPAMNSNNTRSLWIKTSSSSSNMYALDQGVNRGTISFINGLLNSLPTGWGGGPYLNSVGSDLRDGAWHHVVVVEDGTDIIGYIDGVHIATVSGSVIGSVSAIEIGRYGGGGTLFEGNIDDVRSYNVTKSAAQVLELSQGTNDTTGLVYHAKFDDDPVGEPNNTDPILWWQSSEGNRSRFQQPTPASRLTFVKNAIGTKAGVLADGVDDFMKSESLILANIIRLFLVVKPNTLPNAYQVVIATADEASANRLWSIELGNTANKHLNIRHNNAGTESLLDGDTVLVAGNPYIFEIIDEGATTAAEVNDIAQVLTADTGTNEGKFPSDVTGADNTTIGAIKTSAGNLRFGNVTILEIIGVNNTVTEAQLNQIRAYLNREYL